MENKINKLDYIFNDTTAFIGLVLFIFGMIVLWFTDWVIVPLIVSLVGLMFVIIPVGLNYEIFKKRGI